MTKRVQRARYARQLGAWAKGGAALVPAIAVAFGGCALALGGASGLAPHRAWGAIAAVGYGIAALAAVVGRLRGRAGLLPAAVAVAGAVLLPLVALVVTGRSQLEVAVVERSGGLLLSTGSPYLAEPSVVADYNPYLPGMAVFGLPRALFGDGALGDARWWMAAAFLAALAGAAAVLARRTEQPRPAGPTALLGGTRLLWLVACPIVALPLAVGGIDLPVIGLMCLGLALAGRGQAGRAGLVLGVAAALKWTAWPALPVAFALMAVRHGRRPALRAGAVAALTAVVAVAPFALAQPSAFVENVIAFPLGLGATSSPAASPLPGHLLAAYVPGGTVIAGALLAVSAVLILLWLRLRPPLSVRAAADRLALGLGLAMALMPATRFGYLVYPLVLWALPRLGTGTAGRDSARGGSTAAAVRDARPGAAMSEAEAAKSVPVSGPLPIRDGRFADGGVPGAAVAAVRERGTV